MRRPSILQKVGHVESLASHYFIREYDMCGNDANCGYSQRLFCDAACCWRLCC